MKTVHVADYHPDWPESYLRARRELVAILPEERTAVHHVGSTSVPGLAAKPVIDILIDVPVLEFIDACIPGIEELGYVSRGEHGIAGRRYFSRPAADDLGVHLHAFASGHPQILRHLVFRNYLREHANDARRYADLKRTLAREYEHDRDGYQAAKADFVEAVHRAAFDWHASRGARRRGGGASDVVL